MTRAMAGSNFAMKDANCFAGLAACRAAGDDFIPFIVAFCVEGFKRIQPPIHQSRSLRPKLIAAAPRKSCIALKKSMDMAASPLRIWVEVFFLTTRFREKTYGT